MEYKVPSQCNSTWVNKISMEHKYCWYSEQQSYFLSVPLPNVLACPLHWPAALDYLAASPNLNYLAKNIILPLHHYFCTHSLSSPMAPLPFLRSLPWPDCRFLLLSNQSGLNESPHSNNPSSTLLSLRINLAQSHLCPPSCCQSLSLGLCRNSPFWSVLASQPKQSG